MNSSHSSENRMSFAKLSKSFNVNNEWNVDSIFVKSVFWRLNDFSYNAHDFKISVSFFRMICQSEICRLSKSSLLIRSTIVFCSLSLLNEVDLKIWWSILIVFDNNSARSKQSEVEHRRFDDKINITFKKNCFNSWNFFLQFFSKLSKSFLHQKISMIV